MLTNHAPSFSDGNVPLTPCELQVCYELIRTPLSLKEIATKLGKSLKTVDVQATSTYRKLNVTSRLELIQRFGSGKEVKVSHLSSRDIAHGIMERLDEINSKLNYLLEQSSYFRDTAAYNYGETQASPGTLLSRHCFSPCDRKPA